MDQGLDDVVALENSRGVLNDAVKVGDLLVAVDAVGVDEMASLACRRGRDRRGTCWVKGV